MKARFEQIAPETMQAIIAQATMRRLLVNDYLRQLLGLTNGHDADSAVVEGQEEAHPRNEAMLAALRRSEERLKNMPFSGSTEEALRILREGRAGEMYGYEPTE
jgi:hypothetical protein